jgi:hypothetical protein
MPFDSQPIQHAIQSVGFLASEQRLGKGRRRLVCASRGDLQGPGRVSFCLERRRGRWVLSTWGPAFYLVPERQDVAALCLEVLRSGGRVLARLTTDMVRRFGLQELTEEEFDRAAWWDRLVAAS